ncbi:MAG: hypothetical protein M1281_01580 [Chloroflexi bacterium]|nr:hypothetical protein [Chloroflexota bacterium]
MKTNAFSKSLVIFVALTLAGVGMIVLAQSSTDAAVRQVLPLVGSVLFGSGLTYFLVEAAQFSRQK